MIDTQMLTTGNLGSVLSFIESNIGKSGRNLSETMAGEKNVLHSGIVQLSDCDSCQSHLILKQESYDCD